MKKGGKFQKIETMIRNSMGGLYAIAGLALVGVLYLSGNLSFIENKIHDERFRLVQRDATANSVIVAIDSFSLKEFGVWPWPRRLHARLLDNLVAAGVNRIVLDLDFSSESNSIDDGELENALERAAGKVVMIGFHQYQDASGERTFHYNSPIKRFQQYAVTASANIRPDNDGIVRRHGIYQEMEQKNVLTVPAVIVPSPNLLNSVFSIDFGIRPSSIPVLSYSDVLFERVNLSSLAGKNVLVGSTAIELGDQLAVPVYRSLPGVFVLVEAIETLAQNRAIMSIDPIVISILMVLLFILVGRKFYILSWRKGFALLSFATFVIAGFSVLIFALLPVSIDIVPLVAMLCLSAVVGWTRQIDFQALNAFRTSMELRGQSDFSRRIIENAFDGILVLTSNGNIEFSNDAIELLFGYDSEEILGKNINFILGAVHPEKNTDTRASGMVHFISGETETIGTNRDGSTFPVEISISKIESPISRNIMERRQKTRVSFLCTIRNISRRKESEAEFRDRHDDMTSKSRLISVNEMASGLAHEINQPLTAIFGYLDGVKRRLEHITIVPESLIEALDKALGQADRAREIVRRARNATQKLELNRSSVDLNSMVKEVVELLKFDISRHQAIIHLDLAPVLPRVEADAIQIQQVLINICRNGMEAMLELPTVSRYLTIETSVSELGFVQISIKDNGPGFTEDIKDKIFFPFATTKKDGVGIGLSICASIIDDHNGKITAEKEEKGPTVFAIILPSPESSDVTPTNTNVDSADVGIGLAHKKYQAQ